MAKRGNGWKQKVDRVAELDRQIKALQEELNPLKAELKDLAKKKGALVLEGHRYKMNFLPYVRSQMTSSDLFHYLQATGQLDRELRRSLDPYIKVEQDNWGRVFFSAIVLEMRCQC